jgi:hypothetical protein
MQFPRLFAVATVPRLRGSTSGPGGEMSFPAVARTPFRALRKRALWALPITPGT